VGVLGIIYGSCIIIMLFLIATIFSFLEGLLLVLDLGSFSVGGVDINRSFMRGSFGSLMILIVLIVGVVVFKFSLLYIGLDKKFNSFSLLILVFIFGVILLLCSDRIYPLILGWELLGVVRFFLIGYYINRLRWGGAIVTIFINRLGDVGLIYLIILSIYFRFKFDIYHYDTSFFVIIISFLLIVITKRSQTPFRG